MADKKITQLTSLTTLTADDLFVVVDDPVGTPVTKKITADAVYTNLLGSSNFSTAVGSFSGNTTTTATTNSTLVAVTAITGKVTHNAVSNGTANTVVGGQFLVNATGTSTNTGYQYGILATSRLADTTANVVVEHAAAKFVLDVGNSGSLIVNTYGAIIQISNSQLRTQNTQAFIGFGEQSRGTTNSTVYLFDIGLNGTANATANLTVNSNSLVMFTNSAFSGTHGNSTPTHKLKVRVNGANYWILLSNTHQ